jgi:hypothetical protein
VQTLVPPRPNLGPEPWREAPVDFPAWAAGLALLALAIMTLLWTIRRRRGRQARSDAIPVLVVPDDVPGARLLNLSRRAREAMAKKFGPTIWARTTEEIATDPSLGEQLGPHLNPLLGLLRLADHRKFAPPSGAEGEETLEERLTEWEAWLGSFEAEKLPQARPDRPQS